MRPLWIISRRPFPCHRYLLPRRGESPSCGARSITSQTMPRQQEQPIRHSSIGEPWFAPARPAPKRVAPPAPANRLGDWPSALIWGGGGFVVGAVFWHLIGFWSFVSAVVLGDTDHRRTTAEAQKGWTTHVIGPPSPARTTNRRTAATPCTALAIDRTGGATASRSCPTGPSPAASPSSAKTDRLASPVETDAAEAAALSGPPSLPAGPSAIATSAARPASPPPP